MVDTVPLPVLVGDLLNEREDETFSETDSVSVELPVGGSCFVRVKTRDSDIDAVVVAVAVPLRWARLGDGLTLCLLLE